MVERLRKVQAVLKQPPSVETAIYLGLAALVIVSVLVRIALIDYKTLDYGVFSQWYDFIKDHGIQSFKYNFSNYTFPYLIVLYSCALLPISKIAAIKLSMLIFDFVLAYSVYKVVGLFRKEKYTAVLAGLTTLYLPTVFLNSSFWAQIDATYTAFLILSLYYILKNQSRRAWVWFGVALAFKFQAVFFLPALLFATFKRINWYDFYWGALAYVVLMFPPILFGRPFMDTAKIYFEQSKQFNGMLTLNAPNWYEWLPNSTFQFFNKTGILLTAAAIIFAGLVGLIYKKHSRRELLLFSSLTLFLIPFLLPQMHERYFYPAEISALILAFVYPAYAWLAVLMQLVTFFAYWPFMFLNSQIIVPMAVLPFGTLIIIGALCVLYMRATPVAAEEALATVGQKTGPAKRLKQAAPKKPKSKSIVS